MKKLLSFFLVAISLVALTACGDKNVSGTLEDIMESVYQYVPEDNRPMALTNMEVTEDNVETFIGTKDIEYEEVLASESMVGSIAHSVVLVRMKDGASIEDAKTKILDNVNPRKWVCVGIEKEDVIIKNKGNLIVVIIVEDEANRKALEKGFNNL